VEHYRNNCIIAINEFLAAYSLTKVVVTSRLTLYESSRQKLNLNGAIIIQPLNEQQVAEYLTEIAPELQIIKVYIANNPQFSKLITTPLFLTLLINLLKETGNASLDSLGTKDIIESAIKFSIRRMAEGSNWSAEQFVHCLTRIATYMKQSNRFSISYEEIDTGCEEILEVVAKNNLLRNIGTQEYAFPHRIIMEYFIAED
jgi:hypothetical protein